MIIRLVFSLLLARGVACGGDWEFNRVVSAVEHHYGVKQTHIPLMGLGNLLVKVAHPAGARGFKVAIFEGLDAREGDDDSRQLDRFMRELGSGLHPLVITHSRRDDSSCYILAGEVGTSTKLLIATFERSEATVLQLEVDIDILMKLVGSPEHAGKFDQGR